MDEPDFSELPEVAWVTILSYLPLHERFRVSETCHRLNGLFNHPSLWSVYAVQFWGDAVTDTYDLTRRRSKYATLHTSQTQVIKRFGKYFQHLKIVVHGQIQRLARETIDIITEIARECRLETLTVNAGTLTSTLHTIYGSPPSDAVVTAFLMFVKNTVRMKHLHIRSWPMYADLDTPEFNIFRSITENKKLGESLESLTMFGIDDVQWTERDPVLLSAPVTLEVVGAFSNLSLLGLRSPMISEELLEMFTESQRRRLDTLQIYIHYQPANGNFKIPTIRSRIWQALVSRNPKFRVQCTILLKTPDIELASMLTPEVPVSCFKVLQYAELDPSTLARLHTHYGKTLTSFICFSDARCQDDDILKLVTRCQFLEEFVYNGEMFPDTVISIAKQKKDQWKRFEVKTEQIKTPDRFADIDEDEVISRGPDGQLFLVDLMRFHQPEEERSTTIAHLTSEVTKALGVPWSPS